MRVHRREEEVEKSVAILREQIAGPEIEHPRLRTGTDYYVIAWAKALRIPLVGEENHRATESRKAMARGLSVLTES